MDKEASVQSSQETPQQASQEIPPKVPALPTLPPITGLDVLGRGIKLIPGKLYELKGHLLNRGNKEELPFIYSDNNQLYSFLDGCVIDESPPIPEQQALNQTIIVESFERLRSVLSIDYNIAAGYGPLNVNVGSTRSKNLYKEHDTYYVLRNAFVPLWMVYLPHIELMENEVNTDWLPFNIEEKEEEVPAEILSRYDEYQKEFELYKKYGDALDLALDLEEFSLKQKAAYDKLFDTYGTHYVSRAWVGGKALLTVMVSRSSELEEENIKKGVNAIFSGLTSGTSTEEKSSSEHLLNNTEIIVSGAGGDKALLATMASSPDPENYNKWLRSIRSSPAVIALEVKGIWTLIPDPDKAESLRKAYEYLTGFRRIQSIVKYEEFIFISRGEDTRRFEVLDEIFGSIAEVQKKEKRKREDFKALFRDLINSKLEGKGLEESKLDTFKKTLEQMLGKYLDIGKVINLGAENDFLPIDAGVILDSPQDHLDPKTPPKSQKMYFFKENRYLIYDLQKGEIAEGPKYIQDTTNNKPNWPGMTFDRVDEVINWGDGKAYFFYGGNYIRFDLKEWKADEHYPQRIKDRWRGVMFDRIDAAVVLGQKIFFFRNDQYIVYDMVAYKADPGFPKELVGLYIGGWDIPFLSIL